MTIGASIEFASPDPGELLKFLESNPVDVLFLDIDLKSKLNGIEIAKQIRKNNKHIYLIFITAHFEYIVSAYECKTFDFIHKPFNMTNIEKTIKRLADDIHNNSAKFLNLSNNKQFVNQDLINFIEKSGAKTVFNLNSGIVETYGSFNKISRNLPCNFIRCHKSFIVNINNIRNIDFKTDTIFFKTPPNSFCFIGGKYRKNFMEVINNYGNFK